MTHSLVILLALKFCDITSTDDTPADFPSHGSDAQKEEWFSGLARRIVAFCWDVPASELLAMAREGVTANSDKNPDDIYPYCTCGEGACEYLPECYRYILVHQSLKYF